ncbi:MAG: hypothetical protein A3F89_08055 [Deltaproteobacteria bacterium RIFCSPLOWO2_12_FULL_50_11]|nr:MAG: hypothetical protein A2053_01420 [Deltaproteobacteria bacterium GWA2_50_8]OGQ25882.1 MAG: hypothetical protein A3B79_08075 [Deltaproteobacteria bacterium RIFCSPHIGHO2_02_FULL_50_15]OGQ66093.1 MAG: hypothetical protein A3F89_08055 [Deltaproteobacteria bacterium RIFCSPLOWO2_12_FULL_50_11]
MGMKKKTAWTDVLRSNSSPSFSPAKRSWIENQSIIQYWIMSQYREFIKSLEEYEATKSNHDFLKAKMILKKTRYYVQSLINSELYQFEGLLGSLQAIEDKMDKKNYIHYLTQGQTSLGQGLPFPVVIDLQRRRAAVHH